MYIYIYIYRLCTETATGRERERERQSERERERERERKRERERERETSQRSNLNCHPASPTCTTTIQISYYFQTYLICFSFFFNFHQFWILKGPSKDPKRTPLGTSKNKDLQDPHFAPKGRPWGPPQTSLLQTENVVITVVLRLRRF